MEAAQAVPLVAVEVRVLPLAAAADLISPLAVAVGRTPRPMLRSVAAAVSDMRQGTLALLGFLTVVGAAKAQPFPPGPSFDCARAATPIEKAICSDGDDTASDRDLARSYKKVLAGPKSDADKAALRDSQRAWVKQRDTACTAPKPPLTIGLCLRPFYAQRLNDLDNWGSAGLPGRTVTDDALAAAYGSGRSDVSFTDAEFSPDGKLLAFTASMGSGRTAWLFDPDRQKLLAVSPLPPRGGSTSMEPFYWVGSTLYGQGQTSAANTAPVPFRFAATLAGSRPLDKLPPVPVTKGEIKDVTDSNASGGERDEKDARFGVSSNALGHGAFSLTATDGKTEWTIEKNGGWELTHFLFDSPRERVLYAGPAGALTIYDLATRQKRAFSAPPGDILALSNDGITAVVAAHGPCQGKIAVNSPPTQHLCLITLLR